MLWLKHRVTELKGYTNMSSKVYSPNLLQVRHFPNNQTFNEGNLEVSTELHGKTVTWRPTPATTTTLDGNLLGTIRVRPLLCELINTLFRLPEWAAYILQSLDRVDGSIELNCLKQPRSDLHCQLG